MASSVMFEMLVEPEKCAGSLKKDSSTQIDIYKLTKFIILVQKAQDYGSTRSGYHSKCTHEYNPGKHSCHSAPKELILRLQSAFFSCFST